MYKPIKDSELDGRIQAFLDRHADRLTTTEGQGVIEHRSGDRAYNSRGLKFRVSHSF